MQNLELSEVAQLAVHYVNATHRHIFLTGKAGSGKTTLLKYIIQNTYKTTAVAAPTGIAAINAGGVSLHSLLQLPIGSFVPEDNPQMPTHTSSNRRFYTPKIVLAEQRIGKEKRKLLRKLELLIIDEVSMLRADLLDCADLILRKVRRDSSPFGGLQVLFIGDLNQLPPIVRPDEWQVLRNYYSSIFFFGARALVHHPPVYIELDKIYRQSDQRFIQLLNRLRDNQLYPEDIQLLNQYHDPDLTTDTKEGYINITTHNHQADTINQQELSKILSEVYKYPAEVEGDFPERMYPCAEKLELKKGTQVMFIKNDSGESPRYYNGKIGKVVVLEEDAIGIRVDDETEGKQSKVIYVAPFAWENKRYIVDKETGETEEEIIGTFTQYPLKLAWAITVHKSQGLTFEKAILDLSKTFAPGQMYVALSRLTGLQGMVLAAPIPSRRIAQDPNLISFNQQKASATVLSENLEKERQSFVMRFAYKAFDLNGWESLLKEHLQSFDKDAKLSTKQAFKGWTEGILAEFVPLREVADKFVNQIARMLSFAPSRQTIEYLQERVGKATAYFLPQLLALFDKFDAHKKEVGQKKKVKKYRKELTELQQGLIDLNKQIVKAELLVNSVANDEILSKESLENSSSYQAQKQHFSVAQKTPQTSTHDLTFELYQAGKSPEEIAIERGLTPATIEGHLSRFVEKGELSVTDFLPQPDLDIILAKSKLLQTTSLQTLKEALQHVYDYPQLKMALAHQRFLEGKQSKT
ncbi:helix-turn-helix domain-containing protein [uncultured Microscilla sp.]|uniref:helix-turn-helix domain-containing protein n=1 Tax=uncultured Microscilla sp. TaxID=432653 RepID=UPI002626C343|nr:helix-turn-helix domain-containing protein [uncultured Microscilla sp.]